MHLPSLAAAVFLSLFTSVSTDDIAATHTFDRPVDALSVTLPTEAATARVSYFAGGAWSGWQTLAVENEQDPLLHESNLVLFPDGVTKIRLESDTTGVVPHPVHVSREPVRYAVAATASASKPRILSRSQWGADESLLLRTDNGASSKPATEPTDNGERTVPQRVQDCEDAQRKYPSEFKVSKRVTADPDGTAYRWPQEYSSRVRLLVVHHTAMDISNDTRPAVERMRALYQYHAQNRGWGDIGYNYVIDEKGQIYEGRAGGRNVIAGHAYCNNIGTIGIALMGNFELVEPSQSQMSALQWLLADLAETHDIDLGNTVTFHGKKLQPVVGHRDLLSTDCPGFFVHGAMDQIRTHVRNGELTASVAFPKRTLGKYADRTTDRLANRVSRQPATPGTKTGVSPLGTTVLTGRPGATMLFSLRYQGGGSPTEAGAVIANITRSHPDLLLWQEKGSAFLRIRDSLLAPTPVPGNGSTQLRLKVQLPPEAGDYELALGSYTYRVSVSGRRSRDIASAISVQRPVSSRARLAPSSSRSSTSSSRSISSASSRSIIRRSSSSVSSASSDSSASSPFIRIRLSQLAPSLGVTLAQGTTVGGQSVSGNLTLSNDAGVCALSDSAKTYASGDVIRIDAKGGLTGISLNGKTKRYRGIIECRVEGHNVYVINELPMEEYLWGLAEEPDTEPYQKQRAFAITARTYAAYYLDASHRKFPGKPYDGSDSPAQFQAYGGYELEAGNPRWVEAVKDTAGTVLTKDGQIIRAPYFSADDGRTRSPAEAGWNNFPFAEIFESKPDPWCEGDTMRGHGVGMSGCGSEGQANEGKSAEDILKYYYPGTVITGY